MLQLSLLNKRNWPFCFFWTSDHVLSTRSRAAETSGVGKSWPACQSWANTTKWRDWEHPSLFLFVRLYSVQRVFSHSACISLCVFLTVLPATPPKWHFLSWVARNQVVSTQQLNSINQLNTFCSVLLRGHLVVIIFRFYFYPILAFITYFGYSNLMKV